ncbi:MAG: redoxin domain-containing protein [Haloarculaceae archaeon]
MLSEGDTAPSFELPALVDGDHRRVALDEYVGEDVVILAFYPADFNPACDAESDLDELDLFTMQKDVTVLGVGPDSLYSHAAFADEYDLHIPLLSDTDHEVAEQYGVAFEDEVGQQLLERAVFVVDHDGEIAYAWSTREMDQLPNVEEIKDAIAETGGDDTAFARYRVGHAHYVEGRRAFTSAMGSFGDAEWMLAQGDFQRARDEFEEAREQFDSAVRFCDDEQLEGVYRQAKEKADALWQAADWLVDSASAYSSGSGAKGQELRSDAERPLETARDLGEPPDPDTEWPPDPDDEDGQNGGILTETDDDGETTLAVDIDEEVAAQEADEADADDETEDEAADEINDEELAEIEAELVANQPDEEPDQEELEDQTSIVDAPPTGGPVDDEESAGASDADSALDDLDEQSGSADDGRDATPPGADGTGRESDAAGTESGSDSPADGDAGEDTDGDVPEGEIELDLTDPTGGDDDDADDAASAPVSLEATATDSDGDGPDGDGTDGDGHTVGVDGNGADPGRDGTDGADTGANGADGHAGTDTDDGNTDADADDAHAGGADADDATSDDSLRAEDTG